MKNADTLLNSSAYSSLVGVPKLAQTFSCPVFCYDTASKLSCLPPQRFQGMRTRKHYHEDFSYIMDAKTKGNVGRYINVCMYCCNVYTPYSITFTIKLLYYIYTCSTAALQICSYKMFLLIPMTFAFLGWPSLLKGKTIFCCHAVI